MKYYSADVYAEVYELLSYMDKKEVMKIPIDLLEDIKNSRNKEYASKIDIFDLYNRNNLLPETIEVIAGLGIMYLLPKEESEKIQKKYELSLTKRQEKNYREQNLLKCNSNEIFKNKQNIILEEKKENITIIESKEISLFKKIINYIKNIFKVTKK